MYGVCVKGTCKCVRGLCDAAGSYTYRRRFFAMCISARYLSLSLRVRERRSDALTRVCVRALMDTFCCAFSVCVCMRPLVYKHLRCCTCVPPREMRVSARACWLLQDAHEFLCDLLDALHEETTEAAQKEKQVGAKLGTIRSGWGLGAQKGKGLERIFR
eukprot:5239166-Pleurochrysis_carterae.AAC.5